jgi:hypothetical protein
LSRVSVGFSRLSLNIWLVSFISREHAYAPKLSLPHSFYREIYTIQFRW